MRQRRPIATDLPSPAPLQTATSFTVTAPSGLQKSYSTDGAVSAVIANRDRKLEGKLGSSRIGPNIENHTVRKNVVAIDRVVTFKRTVQTPAILHHSSPP